MGIISLYFVIISLNMLKTQIPVDIMAWICYPHSIYVSLSTKLENLNTSHKILLLNEQILKKVIRGK